MIDKLTNFLPLSSALLVVCMPSAGLIYTSGFTYLLDTSTHIQKLYPTRFYGYRNAAPPCSLLSWFPS